MKTRKAVVNLITSWVGKNEKDGSHKEIIDIYNSHTPLPRNYKMRYTNSWCAATVSALAIKLGYTNIIPVECSCGNMIELAKKMKIWVENDAYVPEIGDFILYDWDDKSTGDNTGWPDHIGTVTYVNTQSGYIEVTEGNYNDAVKKRTISINGKYIRGFITPEYDAKELPDDKADANMRGKDVMTVAHEVIAGKWGSGDVRKKKLVDAGYNYAAVQAMVNQILNGGAVTAKDPTQIQDQEQPINKTVKTTCVAKRMDRNLAGKYMTTANLYCRNDAGTNKKALCKIPAGTTVNCYGYYNVANNVKWPLITFTMDGVCYIGFSSINYLKQL